MGNCLPCLGLEPEEYPQPTQEDLVSTSMLTEATSPARMLGSPCCLYRRLEDRDKLKQLLKGSKR